MDDTDTEIDSDDVETTTKVGKIASNTRGVDAVPQISNARMIAMDLSRLTPLEIRSYPTSQLSSSDLDSAFQYLSPDSLAKVLLNTHTEDLRTIEAKLTPPTFEQTLDRLYEPDRTEVLNRLSSTLP
jgi:Mg/Co/Ni transporter MgtE